MAGQDEIRQKAEKLIPEVKELEPILIVPELLDYLSKFLLFHKQQHCP